MLTSLTLVLLATATTASGLTDYPVFRRPSARIEAIIDRGLIQELIVKCGQGTAIVSFSKIEQRFCDPKQRCHQNLAVVIGRTCGRD